MITIRIQSIPIVIGRIPIITTMIPNRIRKMSSRIQTIPIVVLPHPIPTDMILIVYNILPIETKYTNNILNLILYS